LIVVAETTTLILDDSQRSLADAYRGINMTEKERTQMAQDPDEWIEELEMELATLASDMRATQQRLEQRGFKVDSGNKTSAGWWLTANNRNTSYGGVKVQSDGTKTVVTFER
jgi:hypothetical protein